MTDRQRTDSIWRTVLQTVGQKRNNVMLNCTSVLLADIGKIHFFWRWRRLAKFFGDVGDLGLYLRSPAVACSLLRFSGRPIIYASFNIIQAPVRIVTWVCQLMRRSSVRNSSVGIVRMIL